VLVTGHLGAAAAGAALLAADDLPDLRPEHRQAVLMRQRWPEPRLEVGPLLGPAGATAAIDVSDGLAADVGHICERSGVGVVIEADCVPISDATRAVAAVLGREALELALAGGEDYELAFTAPGSRARSLAEELTAETGVPVTRIGAITSETDRVLAGPDGSERRLIGGWRHF
jgi:thiamine-monophosphate kinase